MNDMETNYEDIINIGNEFRRALAVTEPNTIIMRDVVSDNDFFNESDVGQFWLNNEEDFKDGSYHVTYDATGIIKIERIDEDEDKDEDQDSINDEETFKLDECVICLIEKPNILFCNCGHLCLCEKCNKLDKYEKCPVCRKVNTIKRKI